jgi:spermidine synthase
VLFAWLLSTGVGSFIAKFLTPCSVTLYAVMVLLIALWPLLQLILIRSLRDLIFVHGTSPGFYTTFFYISGTSGFYCLLVGFVLPYALRALRKRDGFYSSGKLYILDTVGDIIGGSLFSFILVYWTKPFVTIALTSTLLIGVALLILPVAGRLALFAGALSISALFYIASFYPRFETWTLASQYGDILRYGESPYGRIVVSREGPQHTFWESGLPFYSDADVVNSEEKVHYPLSQIDRVQNVLLVSGGLGETLKEVFKHGTQRVDYVELDPHLTRMAEELGFVKSVPGLKVVNDDGRHYIKTTPLRYDAVIIDLPDPDTFQINRFYTEEFFGQAKNVLNKGGILSFSLGYSPNYVSDIQRRKLSTIYASAKLHFKAVLLIPGEKAYFLCRDGELCLEIPERLRGKSIQTSYVEGFYHGNVTPERISALSTAIDPEAPINSDFKPRVMPLFFQEWFMKHGSSPKPFILVLVALTVTYLIFLRKEEYVLFSTGLATMGVEMVLLFVFQIMYGYIYLKVGQIITAFLLGLLPGALLGNVHRRQVTYCLLISDVVLLCLLAALLAWTFCLDRDLPVFTFLVYGFLFSFFCGYQFPLAARMIGEGKSPASGCLAADLTGAALGTIAAGTLLIPIWGVQAAIIFLILVKISSNIITLILTRRWRFDRGSASR